MSFTSRRGRPKQEIPETDLGTPELRHKRAKQVTDEPLDWLRKHDIITHKQHWCGIHFRWLYTLRYGATTAQSLDTARENGITHYREYGEWQLEREDEWKEAILHLKTHDLLSAALEYCVYQQRRPASWQSKRHRTIRQTTNALEQLRSCGAKAPVFKLRHVNFIFSSIFIIICYSFSAP